MPCYPYDTTMSEIEKVLRQGALVAAPALLGMVVRVNGCAARIVEVEAYLEEDPASHAYKGPTRRNAPMFLAGGHVYVYRSYGVHWCLNIVTGKEGVGEAVLLRAAEPLEGIPLMRSRRGERHPDHRLLAGPGNLCAGLGVDGSFSGEPLGCVFPCRACRVLSLPLPRPESASPRRRIVCGVLLTLPAGPSADPSDARALDQAAEGSAKSHCLDSTSTSR
ncbi:MAG: hypothetical protein KatS3mg015_2050 [Fimbriimonadales bacterium]|nr:MAG: hypothetical protein KatS3mg015_2050 [Fimbriimonadales bacterium]